jgi:hypothetical protein
MLGERNEPVQFAHGWGIVAQSQQNRIFTQILRTAFKLQPRYLEYADSVEHQQRFNVRAYVSASIWATGTAHISTMSRDIDEKPKFERFWQEFKHV